MELALSLLVAALAAHLDSKVCPLAPAPQQYEETISVHQRSPGGKFDVPNSLQTAARLIDVRSGTTIGWLYLDEHSTEYAALMPTVSESTYEAFHMPGNNMHRRDYYTEAILQVPRAQLPPGVELRSCTLP